MKIPRSSVPAQQSATRRIGASIPNFGRVSRTEAGGNTSFHSFQWNLEKRFSSGYSILTNYAWSRTIDDINSINPFNRSAYRGLSGDDIEHNFKFSNIWDLPRANVSSGAAKRLLHGWQLNSIVIWQSGFPFSVSSGRDNSFSGVGSDLADFLGGNPTSAATVRETINCFNGSIHRCLLRTLSEHSATPAATSSAGPTSSIPTSAC